MATSFYSQQQYEVPDWAKTLRLQPKIRLVLAQLPTPIHRWQLPGVPDQFEVFIKRDDLTGAALSGNKIRKLEFIFGEALENGCDSIITLGGIQSNHARATSIIARQLGLEPHLILLYFDKDKRPDDIGTGGNIMLDRLMGAKVLLHEAPEEGKAAIVWQRLLDQYSTKLRKEGMNPYSLTAGGANVTGCWGYIEAWREMMAQGLLEDFSDVVVCGATGGSLVGLAISNYLTGSKLKIHGVTIAMSVEELLANMDKEIEAIGLVEENKDPIKASQLLDLIGGYIGIGYSLSTEEELKLLSDVSSKTGIVLDRVFTIKTVLGMLNEMKINPSRFRGRKVLFVHTGGLLGMFDGEINEHLLSTPSTNQICRYSDVMPNNFT